jgi:hypothetical protein
MPLWFKTITPMMIKLSDTSFDAVIGSLNQTIPTVAIKAIPRPVQVA